MFEGRIKMNTVYVFGKLIFVREFASKDGSLRVSFSVHDGYRTTDFVVYEYERNFKTGELRKNSFFESLMELNLKEGCYVLIRGQVYSRENSKEVSFRPYALAVIDPKEYETCKRLGFNI
jgi:hypothetical protein